MSSRDAFRFVRHVIPTALLTIALLMIITPPGANFASATWYCDSNVVCAEVFMTNPRLGVTVQDSITVYYHSSGCVEAAVQFSGDAYATGTHLIGEHSWYFGAPPSQDTVISPPAKYVASNVVWTFPRVARSWTVTWTVSTTSGYTVTHASVVNVQEIYHCSLDVTVSPSDQTVYYHPTGCVVPDAHFTGSASGGPPGNSYVYRWDFGNGATATGNPTDYVYPPIVASYLVTLVVTDSYGVSGTATATVHVQEIPRCE